MPIQFTDYELIHMAKDPDALRSAANWHDHQFVMGEAADMDFPWLKHHKERMDELRAEANRLEAAYQNGTDPEANGAE